MSPDGSWRGLQAGDLLIEVALLLEVGGHPGCGPVRLKRGSTVASHLAGPEVALGEVNDLAMTLGDYHLLHSTRAELLDQMGEHALARQARERALELCQNPAERALLLRKLGR